MLRALQMTKSQPRFLRDIEDLRYKPGDRVEPDVNFVPDKPISAYAQVAYTRGLVIT